MFKNLILRKTPKLVGVFLIFTGLLSTNTPSFSHPMPNTVISLYLQPNQLGMEIQMPVMELELAFGENLTKEGNAILEKYYQPIEAYLYKHLQIKSSTAELQQYTIESIKIDSSSTALNGTYLELRAKIVLPYNPRFSSRDFWLHYDAIIHQVPNHFAVIEIKQDFNNGISTENAIELGLIQLDIASNTIRPLRITTIEGNVLKGFQSMFRLGMRHIRVGTDHILFLLTLLLISPLRILENRWSLFNGWSYTAKRFLSISIAFTIGHSVALALGTYHILPIQVQLVEIAIALSILFSAINAIQPIFNQKEPFVALFFGSIHGLAFSEAIANLDLPTQQKVWALLGFNLGIEAMQIIIMLFFFPLLWVSKFKSYRVVRVLIAFSTIVCSLIWLRAQILPLN